MGVLCCVVLCCVSVCCVVLCVVCDVVRCCAELSSVERHICQMITQVS